MKLVYIIVCLWLGMEDNKGGGNWRLGIPVDVAMIMTFDNTYLVSEKLELSVKQDLHYPNHPS